jgi:hypothetical protein
MENKLKKELESCFSDWCGDFDVDIEAQYIYEGYHYFSVIITHKHLGPKHGYGFPARVSEDKCQFDYNEDCWEDVTQANLFCFMWFDEAKAR